MYHPDSQEVQDFFGKQAGELDANLMIPRAVGCKECRERGYRGRVGIFEVILMTERLRDMTLERASASHIRRVAMQLGMRTLREDGWKKIVDGYTTMEEVVRLTQEDEFDAGEIV